MIISGFPGVGKSNLLKLYQGICDLDSSGFDKKDFPTNYIQAIRDKLTDHDVVLVSSHQSTRDALKAEGLAFTLVYPHIERKEEFKTLYRARGNDEAFISLLDQYWEEWIYACDRHEGDRYILREGFFLSDVIERLALSKNINLTLLTH